MKILSLYDGMACGMLAMQKAEIPVDRYVAYEIDKYAVQTASHNFPQIEHKGDVFAGDFTEYKDFDFLIGGSPCFTKGHLILTDKGYKDISEIKVGDLVLTHTNCYRKVIRTNSREAEIYNVSIMGYPIFKTTANHPFYTIKKEKASTQEYMINNSWRKFTKTPEWIEAQHLTKYHFCGQHIHLTNEINQYKIDEETAYILGRYVADGHIRKTKRQNRKNSYQYQVILSIGESKINNFKNKIKNNHFSCYKHTQSVYRCVFSSKELLEFIKKNNFGTSAYTKNIPEFIFNLPQNIQLEFLHGYIDGDGCYVELFNSYSLSTISPKLAFGLQRLITSIYKTNVSVVYSKNNSRPHKINNRVIKSNYPLYTVTFKKGLRKQSVAHIQNNILWTQVKSVINTKQIETVYNIEVEDDNSYTVNNCIVHNCTYWSIAQKNNRETEASGMGWELFSQYVRALKEAEPKYFIYENNKSMSKQIRASITEAFGFEPICINSALVSAQNRQRLYWVGKRNEDGTYSKVEVEQPQDKGILLKDILESGESWTDKSFAYTPRCQSAIPEDTIKKKRHTMVAEPINITSDGKSHTIKAQYCKNSDANFLTNGGFDATAVAEPVGTTTDKKSFALTSYYSTGQNLPHTIEKHIGSMVAEPICVAERGRYSDNNEIEQQFEARTDGKTNTIISVQKDNQIAEPVFKELSEKEMDYMVRDYPDRRFNFMIKPGEKDKSAAITANISKGVPYNICAEPLRIGSFPNPNGELSTSQGMRIYDVKGKSVTLSANGGGLGAKTGLYAIPIEFENNVPTKAISYADGKTYTVYEVKDSQITIKGKQYPIKLADGFYIIRKLTVRECMRLQTVPEWYEFPVSNTQAYKLLGNGWTVDVIVHLINSIKNTMSRKINMQNNIKKNCTFTDEDKEDFENGWGEENTPCIEFGDCEFCPYFKEENKNYD